MGTLRPGPRSDGSEPRHTGTLLVLHTRIRASVRDSRTGGVVTEPGLATRPDDELVNSLVNFRNRVRCCRVARSRRRHWICHAQSRRDRLCTSFASRRSPVRSRYAPWLNQAVCVALTRARERSGPSICQVLSDCAVGHSYTCFQVWGSSTGRERTIACGVFGVRRADSTLPDGLVPAKDNCCSTLQR